MTLRNGLRAITLVASVALLASRAPAATLVECVAAAFPHEAKQQIATKYLSEGLEGLSTIPSQLVADRVAAECMKLADGNDDGQRFRQVSAVLTGFVMREGAAASLRERHKVVDATLYAAWFSLSVADRKRFGDSKDRGPANDIVFHFVSAVRPNITLSVFNRLDEPEQERGLRPIIEDLIFYAIGRGTMETATAGN